MEKNSQLVADRFITIAVDVQNDFLPGGALGVAEGDQVIPPLNSVMRFTEDKAGMIIATGDQHPEITPHFSNYGGTWPTHCVRGTKGAEFDERLDLGTSPVVIEKGTEQTDGYSGFEGATVDGNTIEQLMQPVNRERVILAIGGLATDYCVKNTVLDAARAATRINQARQGVVEVYALIDAMRAVNINPQDEQAALDEMANAGATLITSQKYMECFA